MKMAVRRPVPLAPGRPRGL